MNTGRALHGSHDRLFVGAPGIPDRDSKSSRRPAAFLVDLSHPASTLMEASQFAVRRDGTHFGLSGAVFDEQLVVVGEVHSGSPPVYWHVTGYRIDATGLLDPERASTHLEVDPRNSAPTTVTRCGDVNADGAEDYCFGVGAGLSALRSGPAIQFGPWVGSRRMADLSTRLGAR